MAKAAGGDLDVRTEVRSRDEVGQLSMYFNNMIEQIQTQTEDRIRMEAAETKLRQSLLQSQVNYHFLYNAMSTINALSRRQEYEKIVTVNTALADILQSNMVLHNGDMTCRLSEELDIVRDYWTIQQISLCGDVELEIVCPGELYDCIVPRSILQPLVENSLRHGLIDEETGMPHGHVWITAKQTDGMLFLTVSDDGRGIDSDRLAALQTENGESTSNGRHIGIANIRKRLAYLYKGVASLYVESTCGTTIRIIIPVNKEI
jgi:sensor histidine kinase YesM